MKKLLIVGLIILLLISVAAFLLISSQQSVDLPDPTPLPTAVEIDDDYTASFAIFTNGTFRIFDDNRYHNLSPDVFIEKENPNSIQIKKENVTWADFFNTLPMKLETDCLTTGTGQKFCSDSNNSLKFYINEQIAPNALGTIIRQGDRLLVSYGNEGEVEIDKQFQRIPNIKSD